MEFPLCLMARVRTARRESFFHASARRLCLAAVLCGSLIFSRTGSAQAPGGAGTASAAPLTVQTISRLPPGMTAVPVADPQGQRLQLQVSSAEGLPVVVAQLPLASTSFETVYINGFLYVASADAPIIGVDVREPSHPRSAVSFPPGAAVVSLWGGNSTLLIRRVDGVTMLFDVSDPEHPRYQSVVTPPRPPTPAPAADDGFYPQTPPPKPAYARLSVALRPFMFFANAQPRPTSAGSPVDFSYQLTRISGLWWGIELAPFSLSSYYDGEPSFNSRVWVGYSWRSFALAAALGSGFNFDATFFQIGLTFRFGKIDRVHSSLRILFSAFLPLPYPSSSEFTLEGPINRRIGLRYNFTQDSALGGFYTTLGLQVFVGGDRRLRTTVLTPGLGFIYMRTSSTSFGIGRMYVDHPGVIFSLSVEPRW